MDKVTYISFDYNIWDIVYKIEQNSFFYDSIYTESMILARRELMKENWNYNDIMHQYFINWEWIWGSELKKLYTKK